MADTSMQGWYLVDIGGNSQNCLRFVVNGEVFNDTGEVESGTGDRIYANWRPMPGILAKTRDDIASLQRRLEALEERSAENTPLRLEFRTLMIGNYLESCGIVSIKIDEHCAIMLTGWKPGNVKVFSEAEVITSLTRKEASKIIGESP